MSHICQKSIYEIYTSEARFVKKELDLKNSRPYSFEPLNYFDYKKTTTTNPTPCIYNDTRNSMKLDPCVLVLF